MFSKRSIHLCFQGCESSSFQLISSFLKIFLCQNFRFFFYFQPICGILPNFMLFPFFVCVASHTFVFCIGSLLPRFAELGISGGTASPTKIDCFVQYLEIISTVWKSNKSIQKQIVWETQKWL